MKRKVITFFIILISFLLQSTLFVKLKFGAVSPNLMLVVTSSFGFMRGRKSGIAVGAISGFASSQIYSGDSSLDFIHCYIP